MNDSITTKLLIAVLCCTAATAHAEATRGTIVQIGAVAAADTSLYEGVRADGGLYPLLLIDHKRFYFHGAQGGYRFFARGTSSVALQFEHAAEGYKGGDSHALNGMRKRSAAWESGLSATHGLARGRLELKLTHDISSTHHGYSARVTYGRFVRATAAGATSVYVTGEYHDSRKSDYYFGVSEREAAPGRSAYRQNAFAGLAIGINHTHRISERVSFIGGIGYQSLDRSIRHSPIVRRHGYGQAQAAFLYRI